MTGSISKLVLLTATMFVLNMFAFAVEAQTKKERYQNWKPEQGKYYFSQAWIWHYQDDFSDSQGDIKVFVDTLSGTFLFTHDTYGMSDDVADFILGFQEGTYITGFTDENGKKSLKTDTLENTISQIGGKQYYDEDFEKRTKPTGVTKVFGANSSKWPTIKGYEYKTTFDTPDTFSYDYLSKMNFTLLPVYNFNQRQAASRLPYTFSGALHMNYLLLESTYETDGKKIGITLKQIMPANEVIDLAGYRN